MKIKYFVSFELFIQIIPNIIREIIIFVTSEVRLDILYKILTN
jgi:hypothetical protein